MCYPFLMDTCGDDLTQRTRSLRQLKWCAVLLPAFFIWSSETVRHRFFDDTPVWLGNIVTAPRSDVMFAVTEYGIVNLKGKSIPERAKAMISIAHPDFREDLERDARTNGLIPLSFA